MRSIKTKLILTISILILILLSAAAFLFINEKKQELTRDIFVNTRSFAELTAENIVSDYTTYLAQKSFIYFNRNIQSTFERNEDVGAIQISHYKGYLLYVSTSENEQQYEGNPRIIEDQKLLEQIQAKIPSVSTLATNRTIYLKKSDDGTIQYVDQNEKPVEPLQKNEKIKNLVQPVGNEFAVVYGVTYQALQERINQTTMRILLLAIFGVGIGIFMSIIYARSITKPIKKLTDGAEAVAAGDFKYRVEINTKDEIKTLANAFNKMASDLEVSMKAMIYKERVAKELELASKIQKELLPKHMPQLPSLDIAADLVAAEEIGGDLYDFIQADKNNLLMYIGDVTGHGVPSGIVVSIANAFIFSQADKKDIKEILIDANHVLKEKTASNMFITMVMLNWNEKTKKLDYVNAGHEQMIHYHAKDKKVTLLPPGGLALGMFPDISKNLKEESIDLKKDDVLVLYSDGIPECWKNEKEMYGMERFKESIFKHSRLNDSNAIKDALLTDVKDFAGKYKQMDDITLIVLKRK